MADTAFQTQYRDEYIAGFEQRVSLLRQTVTTEAVIKGNQAVFLVADSGGAETVTRGVNGLIPARATNNVQNTATLTEEHDKARITGFNVFGSQGDQRRIMQVDTMGTVNRKIDNQIFTVLNTGTVTVGSSTVIPNVDLYQNASVKLQNASVPWDSNITLLCQPSYLAYLEQATEFASADYISLRPYAGEGAEWKDSPMAYRWRNTLVISHPNLPGKGTSSEKSFLYHKSAVGHAADTSGMQVVAGYDEEDDYSYARCSMYMGAVLLQNAGIVVMTHDGSNYA